MKFNIPKITRRLALSDYDPEYGAAEIQVWVNPPREHLKTYQDLLSDAVAAKNELNQFTAKVTGGENLEQAAALKDQAAAAIKRLNESGEKIQEWMAATWSQGKDPETHWSVEDVAEVVRHSQDSDPGLWQWMTGQTIATIRDYRARSKNASVPHS